jgi:AcrR family transcriptional regulator
VEAALQIVDADGLDGLSMRRLGGELGVDPMMVYRHVAGKDALVDLVLERVRSEMVVPQPPPDDLADLFETIFVEYRRVLAAHPNVIPLATRRTDVSRPSGLEHLVRSGVPLDDAVKLYQSLTAFTVGFSALGAPAAAGDWDRFPDPLAERLHDWSDATFRRTLRLILAGYGLGPPGSD